MGEKTASDIEMSALLGHARLYYVGRDVRNTQAEGEAILENKTVEAP